MVRVISISMMWFEVLPVDLLNTQIVKTGQSHHLYIGDPASRMSPPLPQTPQISSKSNSRLQHMINWSLARPFQGFLAAISCKAFRSIRYFKHDYTRVDILMPQYACEVSVQCDWFDAVFATSCIYCNPRIPGEAPIMDDGGGSTPTLNA